ncbi:hypothetical protein IP87_02945 [beta proteobacterium AAP121]|nr:hypothetical protein IP80_11385 [beta proteobacterium AAP65]KPG00320.1 hypothetical protein IP87_02945 [beta proteobacterium AAP121]
MPSLNDYTARAIDIPAMPEVAQKLMRSLSRDDLSLQHVADLVSRDQALAGKVLRLANSSRFSPARNVATLKDATMVLGLGHLRDLTLSACLSGALPSPQGFDRLRHWRGSMAMAAYAQAVAHALGEDQDVAYLGGLMLRSGRILMALVDPQRCLEVDLHATVPDSTIGWEETLMGCSHPQVSTAIAAHWHFPAVLEDAFRAAADPLAARPFSRLGAVLRLASVITDLREAGQDAAVGLAELQAPLLQHLGLQIEDLCLHLPPHEQLLENAQQLLH